MQIAILLKLIRGKYLLIRMPDGRQEGIKRKRLRKIAAAALAAMLAVQIVPATGMERAKAANEDGLTAYYDMSHSGNSLMDISGNDNHATLYGARCV